MEAAQGAIHSAKIEAICNKPNGIGIVKLMGRSAGFIAAHATMSSSDVDLCLVPEVPLVLEGANGCLPHIYRRVREQGYAVVVVAEGAGEDVLGVSADVDAGGNRKLPPIGEFMKEQIVDYFKKKGDEATVKYIDPSYMVRSVAANAADSLCKWKSASHKVAISQSLLLHFTNCTTLFSLFWFVCGDSSTATCDRLHAIGTERRSRCHGGLHGLQRWSM